MNVAASVLRIGVTLSCALLAAGLILGTAQVVNAGLVVLMLTPAARVAVVTHLFVRRREWTFAGISIGVLLLIGVSLLLAMQ